MQGLWATQIQIPRSPDAEHLFSATAHCIPRDLHWRTEENEVKAGGQGRRAERNPLRPPSAFTECLHLFSKDSGTGSTTTAPAQLRKPGEEDNASSCRNLAAQLWKQKEIRGVPSGLHGGTLKVLTLTSELETPDWEVPGVVQWNNSSEKL